MKSERHFLYGLEIAVATSSFVFILIYINPVLHYHCQHIAWLKGIHFFEYFTTYPGGPGEYLSLFVAQLFGFKWVGAFLISAISLIIVLLLSETLLLNFKTIFLPVFWLSSIQYIILALFCNYSFSFSVIINLLFVSLFLYFSFFARNHFNVSQYYTVIPSGFLLYVISGGASFLIFLGSVIFILFKTPRRNNLILIGLLIISGFLVPWLSEKYLYVIPPEQSYLRSVPDVAPMLRYSKSILFYTTLTFLPLTILVNLIAGLFPKIKKQENTNYNTSKSGEPSFLYRNISVIMQVAFLVFSTVFLLYFCYKPQEKLKIEIDYFASREQWDKVIDNCSKVADYDRMVNFQFNRAIAHTGKMLERLFDYPQVLGVQGLFLDRPFTSEVALPNSDLYFDLGNIDESQRYAYESQTLMPYSPRVLKKLIINSLILENYDVARTFSNVMSQNPVENNWAKSLLPIIENQDMAGQDKLIAGKRYDFQRLEGIFLTPHDKLIALMEKNNSNKKAFEYLIAFDLMEHNLAAFTEDMKYYRNMNYTKLPKVIEEAVVLFSSQRPGNEFLKSFRISGETLNHFSEFVKAVKEGRGNKENAKINTSRFRNTYWYYVLFDSPIVTKVKLETKPSEANY